MDRLDMARQIVAWEARRDADGHLRVYLLPPNDGGGTFEIAGINEKYDHDVAVRLRTLVEEKKFQAAEDLAVEYIADQTDAVADWSSVDAVQFFLRDTMFNRGLGGAAKILQIALGVKVDGIVGHETRGAAAVADRHPVTFLLKLRMAREEYEQRFVGIREIFWAGLQNRWDNAFETSIAALYA